MVEEIEEEDLKWLEHVREHGKLLEIFDLRVGEETHLKSNRIEVYYMKKTTELHINVDLMIFIKFDGDTIVGFETY